MEGETFLNKKRENIDISTLNEDSDKLKLRISEIKDDYDYILNENNKLKEKVQMLEQKNSKLKFVVSKLNDEKSEMKNEIDILNQKLKTNIDEIIESRNDIVFQAFINQEKKREEKVKILEEKLRKSIQISKNLLFVMKTQEDKKVEEEKEEKEEEKEEKEEKEEELCDEEIEIALGLFENIC